MPRSIATTPAAAPGAGGVGGGDSGGGAGVRRRVPGRFYAIAGFRARARAREDMRKRRRGGAFADDDKFADAVATDAEHLARLPTPADTMAGGDSRADVQQPRARQRHGGRGTARPRSRSSCSVAQARAHLEEFTAAEGFFGRSSALNKFGRLEGLFTAIRLAQLDSDGSGKLGPKELAKFKVLGQEVVDSYKNWCEKDAVVVTLVLSLLWSSADPAEALAFDAEDAVLWDARLVLTCVSYALGQRRHQVRSAHAHLHLLHPKPRRPSLRAASCWLFLCTSRRYTTF